MRAESEALIWSRVSDSALKANFLSFSALVIVTPYRRVLLKLNIARC